MNILLINHYAGSPKYGMEFRPYYLAREWNKQGHNTLIVAGSFSHLRRQQPEKLGHDSIDGINYYWLKTLRYNGNGVKRSMSMLQFVTKLWIKRKCYLTNNQAIKQSSNQTFIPDIVIASSTYPLDIYPAKKIAKRYGAKLIYEVHDLWPLSPMVIGGYSKYHPFIWVMQQAENYAYKHVDKVVSLLDKAFAHMQKHGLPSEKFACVPNGYDKAEWFSNNNLQLPDDHKFLFDRLKKEGKTIIGFAGGHTASTAMHIFINAAEKLQSHANLAFVLVGQGSQKEELVEMARKKQLSNTHFLPAVPKQLIPKIISHFDICYMGGVHSILHKYGTSFNKMTDYMLSQKPIVMSVDEPDSVVQRCGCGIQVEAENVDQVAKAILDIASLSEEERTSMGRKGYDYAIGHLEYATLAKQFLQSIK